MDKTLQSSSDPIRRKSSHQTPLLDIFAVAELLGVTPRHVRRLVAERRIPFFKVGRFVRFDPGELDLWLEDQRVEVRRSASFSPTTGR